MEILIVVTIIAILAALLFPIYSRSRELARRSACQSNMKQIGLAIKQYQQDYNQKFPPRYSGTSAAVPDKNPLNWRVLLYPYAKSTQVFRCPSNPEKETSATDMTIAPAGTPDMPVSYSCNYNSGTGLGVFANYNGWDTVSDSMLFYPASTIMVAETTTTRPDIDMDDIEMFGKLYAGHMGFTNYLFTDGHAKAMKPLQTYFTGEDKISNMWHRDHSAFLREDVTP